VAAPKKVVAVDFGSSTLKVAVFQLEGANGLTLLDYALHDLGVDPNKDDDRFAFLLEGLQGIVSQKQLTNLPAICSLSGQFAFTRFVKLPPVSADQVDQMIGFEAQQNVPFPINEVVWDYQLLGSVSGGEYEALIVAIKDDLIEQAAAAVAASKLDLVMMDVSPLALVNSFLYNNPGNSRCNLLIDIGAKCSNLIFVEGSKIFARVIPIGGHMITQNVANEFQEPYKSAELLKHGKGFVGLGGAYADPQDQAAARISKLARSVYSRLHAEVSRSISFYRNQQGGHAPEQLFLSGGSSKMAYSDLFFKEKLNLPVEYFNPLKSVAIASSINKDQLAKDAPVMGELVGLGLRYRGETPMEVNLVPRSVKEKERKKAQMPMLLAAVGIFFLALLLAAGANVIKTSQVQGEVRVLQSDLNEKNMLSTQIAKAVEEFDNISLKAETVSRLVDQRDFWPITLGQVAECVQSSTGLWVTELEMTNNGVPLTVVPQADQRLAGVRGRSRRSGPEEPVDSGPKAVNLAATATELNLRGFFESDLGYDFLNAFVKKLSATRLFEEVKIISRENLEDQVALNFYLQATFTEEARPSLLP